MQTAYTSEYPSYLCGHTKKPLAKCCFTIVGSRHLNQTFQAVDGVQSERLKKIQMGCRCCKMIQSYIFDSEEVQSGCIHEVNSYQHNEQGSYQSKFKENSEIQEHINELQKDELNRTENKPQVNSTKETLWNHRGHDFQDDSLVTRVAKLDVAVNGGNSCTGVHPMLSPNTNPGKEASEQGPSSQSVESPSASNRDFYTKLYGSGQDLDLEAGRQRKAACKKPNNIQDETSQSGDDSIFLKGGAILETQNNAIQLPDIDYPQNGDETRNYVEKDSSSVNCAHPDQDTRPSATQDQDFCVTPPSSIKESSIEPFKPDSASLSESTPGVIAAMAVTKVAQAPTRPDHTGIKGEIEEEDAEVAAALAALDAATAGEDLEDEDEY
ncbi:PDCD10 and GCKIII kinases-associated protein 1 isoform X3 [Phalacrocorax aristotelis]|uniref:PDCD10 and GCKIII kinases-associated protein 1 isoform X3 n=1 Tax=Phalacrocorax aristotelis TaxID=126867 RepID=UPI003F4C9496